MEDIREAALAYYANSSDETKKLANDFFKTIDADGNGVITFDEFQKFANKIWSGLKLELFAELDKNGDGCLDYEEFIVIFYMLTISYRCDGCRKPLNDRYFTSVRCFQNYSSEQTYDVCLTCYKTKQFTPGHFFMDNYTMFMHMRKTLMNGVGQTVFAQASQQAIIFYRCDGCRKPLNDRYFTCVQCFQNYSSGQTYDVCLTCYKNKQFTPGHTLMDNYAMFKHMRKTLMIKVVEPSYTTGFEQSSQQVISNPDQAINWNGVGQTVFEQVSQQVISNPDQAINWNGVGQTVFEQASQQLISNPDQAINWNGVGQTVFEQVSQQVISNPDQAINWNGVGQTVFEQASQQLISNPDQAINWNGVGQTVFEQASQQVISNPDQAIETVGAIVDGIAQVISACSIM